MGSNPTPGTLEVVRVQRLIGPDAWRWNVYIGVAVFAGAAVLCVVGWAAMMRKRRRYEATGEVDEV